MTPSSNTGITKVGRYAIHRKLAAGGMATVHLGRLLGAVGFARTVAIKRLHTQFATDPEFVDMLVDEARIAGRIQHPNVVQTLDVVTAPGELLLVMEYVHGQSLSRLVKDVTTRGELIPLPIVSAIVAGMLHGLHAAHEAKSDVGQPLGIVHRDVSPQNVVVGVDGVARVLDFGIAKAANRLQQTASGQLKGKLAYMSPEQLRAQATNRLIDVYASGVVLWEALTAKRLFKADDEGSLIGLVLEGIIPPPSSVAPHIPPELDAVVAKCTARDPSQRFQSAREAARALESALRPALPSEVGEWVATVSADTLGQRAAYVAELESMTGLGSQPDIPIPSGEQTLPLSSPASPVEDEKTIKENPSSRTAMPVEAPPPLAPTNNAARWIVPLVAMMFVGLAGASLIGVTMMKRKQQPHADTPATSSTIAPTAEPAPPPPTTSADPTPAASAPALASASAPASASASASVSAVSAATARTARPPPAAPTPAATTAATNASTPTPSASASGKNVYRSRW